MMRKILLGLSVAIGLSFGAVEAQGQAIVGDINQGNTQNLGATQNGADVQVSDNSADSEQAVESTLILGNTAQANQQGLTTEQTDGGTQTSSNDADNDQTVDSDAILGRTGQRNRQALKTTQSHDKGLNEADSSAENTQVIESDLILGDTDQANAQTSETKQTAEKGPSSGATIEIVGIGEISVDEDLPTVNIPGSPIIIDGGDLGSSSTNTSSTEISSEQIILGD